ncbi:MAG: TMEM198/TM7SF3 family protein [Desulfobacterales bacterium]|jgi:hypothetical protein|nr:TMEM198/TM7SF3 family protein [Pseudomonadota bacterium]MCG2775432.1 TMEM198/TM7SF3 family protein [Desulfobacterales bacterium]
MGVLNIFVGIALLILGRKLFWLFVACVGFAVGFTYAKQLWGTQSALVILVIALVLGLIGALLAIFLERVAIAVAGFVAGGYTTMAMMTLFGIEGGQLLWLVYVIGGIIGALLLFFIFDWALIALSSIIGAALIIQQLEFSPTLKMTLFFGFLLAGFVFQTALLHREPSGEG